MTPTQFRTAITALGLKPTSAALALGVDQRTVRRYLDGTRPVPKTVEILLGMIARYCEATPATGGEG